MRKDVDFQEKNCGFRKKVAALEEEQLLIKRNIKSNIDSDKELIEIVKNLRNELEILETVDANIAK